MAIVRMPHRQCNTNVKVLAHMRMPHWQCLSVRSLYEELIEVAVIMACLNMDQAPLSIERSYNRFGGLGRFLNTI